ncbi:MAG: aminotransferase class IV [Arcobacteraceae bacterium]
MNYFETIKCDDMEVYNLEYHQKRISRTIAKNITLLDYIYPASSDLLKCKVTYNDDEIIDVSFSSYKKRTIKKLKLIYADSIEYGFKYENRKQLESLYNQREKADDIIIIKNGLITDTTIANIAIYLDDRWITPKTPLLLGTTRQRYIDNGTLKEENISVSQLQKAKKIALLNAMIDFDIIDDFEILL